MKTKYIKVPVSERRSLKSHVYFTFDVDFQKSTRLFDGTRRKFFGRTQPVEVLIEIPDREEEMRAMLERCLESFKYFHANASFAFHESNTDDHIEHLPYRMQELERLLNELNKN